jgi:hypothetical protein
MSVFKRWDLFPVRRFVGFCCWMFAHSSPHVIDTGPLSASSSRLGDGSTSKSSLALPASQIGGLARPLSRGALRAPLSRNSSFTSAISPNSRARSSSLLAPVSSEASGQITGNAASASRPYLRHSRTHSTSSINLPSPNRGAHSNVDDPRLSTQRTERTPGSASLVGNENTGYSLPRIEGQSRPATTAEALNPPASTEVARMPPPAYQQQQQLQAGPPSSIPVADWATAVLLYRCVCVANFRVSSYVRYGSLPFLTLNEGDIIE